MALPSTHAELEIGMRDRTAVGLSYDFIRRAFKDQLDTLNKSPRWVVSGIAVPTTPLAIAVEIKSASPTFDVAAERIRFIRIILELHIRAAKSAADEFRVLTFTYDAAEYG